METNFDAPAQAILEQYFAYLLIVVATRFWTKTVPFLRFFEFVVNPLSVRASRFYIRVLTQQDNQVTGQRQPSCFLPTNYYYLNECASSSPVVMKNTPSESIRNIQAGRWGTLLSLLFARYSLV